MVQRNHLQIKQDVQDIIQSEMERLLNNPGLKPSEYQKTTCKQDQSFTLRNNR